jgi:S-adenosylmethionine uptake transporter
MKLSPQIASIWLMLLSCLLFSLMGVFVKLASAYYSVGELVFYRSVIGVFLMFIAARVKRGSLLTRYPKEHLVRSFCGAVALCLWFYSISQLPLGLAMTLNYTAPAWMVLFVTVMTRLNGYESINLILLITVAVGFVGIVLILQPTAGSNQWFGGSLGLLSGVVSAIAFLQVAALGKLNEPGYRVVFYFSLAGIILGIVDVVFKGGFSPHTIRSSSLLLTMGILAAGAQWSLTYAFSNGKTLVNASLQYLTIAFSCVFGGVVFGDRITQLALVGMILVAASGVSAAYFRSKASQ